MFTRNMEDAVNGESTIALVLIFFFLENYNDSYLTICIAT